ncbi:MAG: hypothetical protein LBD78_06015 [Spirochaetaceae bacterium]|jgi:hypothetical protein|nr:hypothetical protein [Spirochaetaceae bacterium]
MGRSLPGKMPVIACFMGMVLSLLLAGGMVCIVRFSGRDFFSSPAELEESSFYRKLRDYDGAAALTAGSPESADPERLIRLLDGLEREALGVEAQLSVLKRRRALAAELSSLSAYRDRFLEVYRSAALRQAADFPFSQPLAAVAAEALIRSAARADTRGESLRAAAEAARDYGGLISDPSLLPLSMAVFILAGDMEDPGRAAAIPRVRERLEAFIESAGTANSGGTALAANGALLSLLRGDIREAGAAIRALLKPRDSPQPEDSAASAFVSPRIIRLAAEFFYDFGPLEQSAELFSRFPDPRSIARQADALWLSGREEGARNLWFALAVPGEYGEDSATPPEILLRCLYNLAVSSADPVKKNAWFERLLEEDPGQVWGTIGYTRFMDSKRAVAFLESSGLPEQTGLADLELLRRRLETWPVDRVIPETWLLLGRHPQDQALYQWGAYFFDRQRQYAETAQLLRTAGYQGFSAPWMSLHEALGHIREGKLDAGEALLRNIDGENADWQVPANIGRILEAEHSPAAALEYYEIACSRVTDIRDAAKIQLRIARCLRILGRDQESRRALEYGRSLDGENLKIRLELERLGP